MISINTTPVTVKIIKLYLSRRKHADFLLKMTKFHNITVKTYPHKSLNVSKGVLRSKELSLCTIEEIKRELKKQGVTKVKRISIKKEEKTIETNTYIMHSNTPKIPEKNKSWLYNGDNRALHTQPHCDVTNTKNMATMRIIVECVKCAGNGVNKILTTILMTVNSHVNVPIVAAIIRCTQDLVRVGGKRRKY